MLRHVLTHVEWIVQSLFGKGWSWDRVRAMREMGITNLLKQCEAAVERLRAVVHSGSYAQGTPLSIRVPGGPGKGPVTASAEVLDLCRRAQARLEAIIAGGWTDMPPLEVTDPLRVGKVESMKPVYVDVVRSEEDAKQKRLNGFVDVVVEVIEIGEATIHLPGGMALVNEESTIKAATGILEWTPSWTFGLERTRALWLTVRSQNILLGEVLQEMKRLLLVPGGEERAIGLVGDVQGDVADMIEREGFRVVDGTRLQLQPLVMEPFKVSV